MARKFQYQALSQALFVPVVIAAPPVGGCFTTFSQPAPIAKFPAYLQPQPSYQVGYFGPASTPDRLVFSKFEGVPPPAGRVPAHLQPQPSYQIGYFGPANLSGPLVFSTFSQPRFEPVKQAVHAAKPVYLVGYPGPANTTGRMVFSPFEQPRFYQVKQEVHAAKPVYLVGYPGPANTSGPLVFSNFSQPRFSDFPTHLQPQPALRLYFYDFFNDAEVIQVLQELRVSYSDPREFFSDLEIATVPEETRIASLFQEDRVLVVEPRKVVETDAEFRLDGLPNRLRTK